MVKIIIHVFIILLLLITSGLAYFNYEKERSYSEFHRSKMAQYNYFLALLNRSNNNIEKLKEIVPDMTKEHDGFIVPIEFVANSKYIVEGNYKLLDFYGYYVEADSKGQITGATLYKP